ncbi:MAG: hypothetical protein CSA62_15490, partial [Planctomycetota bacterium]
EPHARDVVRKMLHWYCYEHHHSGIAMLTPAQVHLGLADELLQRRHEGKLAYYHRHPERFINGPPRLESLPAEVWINRPENTVEAMASIASNRPTDEQGLAVKAREATAKPLGLDSATLLVDSSCREGVIGH